MESDPGAVNFPPPAARRGPPTAGLPVAPQPTGQIPWREMQSASDMYAPQSAPMHEQPESVMHDPPVQA